MKGLKVLKELQTKNKNDSGVMRRLDIIEKELKAVEIIKKRKVDIDFLLYSSECWQYNMKFFSGDSRQLPQEEFNILKEVFK